jgi:hypothetical protein
MRKETQGEIANNIVDRDNQKSHSESLFGIMDNRGPEDDKLLIASTGATVQMTSSHKGTENGKRTEDNHTVTI